MKTFQKIKLTSSSKAPTIQVARFPVVQFDYPDSKTNQMRIRYVRLTQADTDFIKGQELEHPFSSKEGTFKQYSRNRIAHNGVSLIRF